MSIYDFAAIAVNAVVPALAETSSYEPRQGGAAIAVRVIPDDEPREMPGQHGRTMFNNRTNFLVPVSDLGAVIPTSGDILTVRGKRWRVAQGEQIHPAAPMWRIECQAAPQT